MNKRKTAIQWLRVHRTDADVDAIINELASQPRLKRKDVNADLFEFFADKVDISEIFPDYQTKEIDFEEFGGSATSDKEMDEYVGVLEQIVLIVSEWVETKWTIKNVPWDGLAKTRRETPSQRARREYEDRL